jgi:cytoskeletal protein CcmA (bactofilin family)
MEGFIRCREDLYIDGWVEGTIELEEHRLTIGEKGRVAAEIRVQDAKISGDVKGTILSHGKVEITRNGRFLGQVESRGIAVEDGAYLKAVIRLSRDAAAAAASGPGSSETGAVPGDEEHVEETSRSGQNKAYETGRSLE